MKAKIYFYTSLIALFISGSFFTSCTNLDETIYHQITADNYYQTSDEVIAALMRPWGHFCGTMPVGQAPWLLQELAADGAAWCQKGRHGYDNGDWIRLHRHQWTAMEGQIRTNWNLLFQGIGYANNMLADLEKIDFEALNVPISKAQAVAEMKVYKAFCYWFLLDMFRDIPIIESLTDLNPETKDRAEVFAYIEKEIKDNLGNLSEDKVKTYGRVSKWGAYALLARLYLNAEAYTGTPRWDDCINACNEVTKGGFAIDTNWNDPFKANNDQVSKENIWVVIYDQIYASGNGWYQRWLHYAHQTGWNLQSGPWNGLVTQPSFYDSFDDNDKRKTEGFLIGTQYPRKKNAEGQYYFDTTAEPLLGSEEYKGEPLVFVNYIQAMDKGEENSGARSIKYEIIEQSNANQDNDWVLFRYSETIFNKAEALIRKNGGAPTQEAVDLVNSVRQRAFAPADWSKAQYTLSTLTLDELIKERGREFAFEGTRRSDLVRFNKFVTVSWWDKEASNNAGYNIFPIPQLQLDANQNLKPNEANAIF
ncbi:MAG: RagB/SusD family nutrient uptake outer membrane protein [Mediterranea sp.]|nr:RagB/SusD family nutrient uptake outer membrane protein [Mediterranea sp.]